VSPSKKKVVLVSFSLSFSFEVGYIKRVREAGSPQRDRAQRPEETKDDQN
jgi:hypothetical protein